MKVSVGKSLVRVTKLEDNHSLGSDHWRKRLNGRSDEQCGEKGVGLGTGLGENFSFPFKGTFPKWGDFGWKVVSNPHSTSSPKTLRI